MPGFLVSRAALDRIAQHPKTDIALRYVAAGIAPIGSVFAATPRDLMDVLRRAGMQQFHAGAFTVTGDIPAQVRADLVAKTKGLSGIRVTSPQTENPLGAQVYTTGSDVHISAPNAQTLPHEATHVTQQRGNH